MSLFLQSQRCKYTHFTFIFIFSHPETKYSHKIVGFRQYGLGYINSRDSIGKPFIVQNASILDENRNKVIYNSMKLITKTSVPSQNLVIPSSLQRLLMQRNEPIINKTEIFCPSEKTKNTYQTLN